ncbi:MAG: competence/damage-inducible protein A [Pirellulaceae bacterium]|nr:competence/damage-inducible protein A [Pirellulaceae bacterium]
MQNLTAEILAIGDEMIGGSRLDTNTQYLAQQLTEIGVQVVFHSTVGDDPRRQAESFRTAAGRVDVVLATGGLGPTADDLTRQVLAEIMEVDLVQHNDTLDHIRGLFRRYGREMPESNLIQAQFPIGSTPIPNSEGTAPGIDAVIKSGENQCRFFCLPGVPAEMHEMWQDYVRLKICEMSGQSQAFLTRVINCFGSGESHIESLLGDLISRGRDPVVGITASQAVISLRIVAQADTSENCQKKIVPVEAFIRERLGDLVYGTGDETLEDVVVRQLNQEQQTLAILDFGLNGDVTAALSRAQTHVCQRPVVGGSFFSLPNPSDEDARKVTSLNKGGDSQSKDNRNNSSSLRQADLPVVLAHHATEIREQMQSTWGLAISWPFRNPDDDKEKFLVVLSDGTQIHQHEIFHAGHSALRYTRSVKQVLNLLRLSLPRDSLNPT